jgi:hypothetical protein
MGEAQLFVIEGALAETQPEGWPGFAERFRVIQKTDRQLTVAALGRRDPADCLKELLALPARVENVTLKRPSLNDTFLQLTGRELRE